MVCAGTSLVDLFNRFLFSAKILFLVVMLVLLAPHVHKVNLLSLPLEKGLALSAIPVIFTSFGFHGSVPSIVSYMNGDIRKLRRVFVIGSAIPLVAYLFWQLVTLGSIDSNTFIGLMAEHSGLNGFLVALQTGAMTFLPPLAFALFYPRGFVMALGYAGVALSILALLLPSLLAWKSRKQHPQQGYRVAGGTLMLCVVFGCGVVIILVQVLIAAGMLPEVG